MCLQLGFVLGTGTVQEGCEGVSGGRLLYGVSLPSGLLRGTLPSFYLLVRCGMSAGHCRSQSVLVGNMVLALTYVMSEMRSESYVCFLICSAYVCMGACVCGVCVLDMCVGVVIYRYLYISLASWIGHCLLLGMCLVIAGADGGGRRES